MKVLFSWLVANFETLATIVLSIVFCLLLFLGTDMADGEDSNFYIAAAIGMVFVMAVPAMLTSRSFGATFLFWLLLVAGLVYVAVHLPELQPEEQLYFIARKLLTFSIAAFVLAIPVGIYTAVNMDDVVSLRMLYVNSDVQMFEMTLAYSLNRFMVTFMYLVWAGLWTAVYMAVKTY